MREPGEFDHDLAIIGSGGGAFAAAIAGRREELRFANFLVATGAEPPIPGIPGLADSGDLTSTTAMELDHLPASVVVPHARPEQLSCRAV